jgi:hypothetical protein
VLQKAATTRKQQDESPHQDANSNHKLQTLSLVIHRRVAIEIDSDEKRLLPLQSGANFGGENIAFENRSRDLIQEKRFAASRSTSGTDEGSLARLRVRIANEVQTLLDASGDLPDRCISIEKTKTMVCQLSWRV